MGINFPTSPTVDQLHPDPAVAGIPQYKWNGTAWVANTPQDALSYVKRSGDTMTGHLSLPTTPAAANAVRKDYVDTYAAPLDALAYSGMQVNGAMEVNQEAVAAIVTGKYGCDGWALSFSGMPGSNLAQDSVVSVPGFPSRIYVGVTAKPSLAAVDYLVAEQRIEGYRIHRLGWGTANAQPITIGFWAQHTLPGTYSVSIRNATTYNRCYVATYTQNVADVLEYKIITIPGDTAGTWGTIYGVGMSISFCAASGATSTAPAANTWIAGNYVAAPGQVNIAVTASNYIVMRGVVILPGISAPTAAQSPLIMRPYDQELETCRRYFTRVIASSYLTSVAASRYFGGLVQFSPVMRTAPTITLNPSYTATNLLTAPYAEPAAISPYGFRAMAQCNTSTDANFFAEFFCNARL